MIIAQYFGWLLTLAIVIVAVGHVTTALIVLIWRFSFDNRQVSGNDAFRASVEALGNRFGFLRSRWVATVCSVAMLSLLLYTGVDWYASFGLSAITFVIAGVAAPYAMRFIRPSPSNITTSVKRKP